MARFLLIHQEQVVAPWPATDVDVLADLDEAVGAEDREPSVTPGAEPARRKPVHAHVARSAIATYKSVAEILESGELRVVQVPDL